MNRLNRNRIRWVLLLLTVMLSLSVTGLAVAQSSNYFDLGCAGALVNGGDVRVSPTAKVRDSLGMAAVGITSSSTAIVRGGNVHQFLAAPTPAPQPSPPITGENLVFLSSVWNFVKNARVCQ